MRKPKYNPNMANLQRMADYIKDIPQAKFDMLHFRIGQSKTIATDSVSDILGHCTILHNSSDPIPRDIHGDISAVLWSQVFTGIPRDTATWEYLFGSLWKYSDNTPKGASLRIEYYINNGLPRSWREELEGNVKLSYWSEANVQWSKIMFNPHDPSQREHQ